MDWQLTCRVCMETGDMVSLFDWDDNNEQLADKYTYCCGLTVTKNDDLPSLICLHCVDRLTFSYQFKQQCLSSVETLKECLEEFVKTSSVIENPSKSLSKQTETITIKQEDGVFLQYELPVEHEEKWTRTVSKAAERAVVTKAPGPRRRGRPRKYPNEQGNIDVSTYQRKKPQDTRPEHTSLTALLEMNEAQLKTEPDDAELGEEEALDDEYQPSDGSEEDEAQVDESEDKEEAETPRKRGRPRKPKPPRAVKQEAELEDVEDVLLKETIMAYSEPLPDHILHPKPKTKPKRKYAPRVKPGVDRLYTCETCGASFTSNASLQAHIRRHLGIKPFVCSICGYACVTKEALKRHMLRHTGEKPYKCRICERRFGDFGTRQKHERLHMGVRPYQCSVCGKSFTYSYVLSNHMLTHTGEKKYSCAPCNKKFTKAHHLKYHNKVHHKDVYQKQLLDAQVKKLRAQLAAPAAAAAAGGEGAEGGAGEGEGGFEAMHLFQVDEEDRTDGMQVVEMEMEDDSAAKETDRAVAGMRAVVLESEFGDDSK